MIKITQEPGNIHSITKGTHSWFATIQKLNSSSPWRMYITDVRKMITLEAEDLRAIADKLDQLNKPGN